MKAFFTIFIPTLSFSSSGQEIFQLKKSRNKLNVLHFAANVENYKFKTPAISNHWIMGERVPDKTIPVRIEGCQAKAYLDFKGSEIQLKELFA